jgi:hypothetical protein
MDRLEKLLDLLPHKCRLDLSAAITDRCTIDPKRRRLRGIELLYESYLYNGAGYYNQLTTLRLEMPQTGHAVLVTHMAAPTCNSCRSYMPIGSDMRTELLKRKLFDGCTVSNKVHRYGETGIANSFLEAAFTAHGSLYLYSRQVSPFPDWNMRAPLELKAIQ